MLNNELWNLIEKNISQGYIKVQKHPSKDLKIYNYSQKAMLDSIWNEATMICRGLIVDSSKNVVARPFKKFFSESQLQSLGIEISLEQNFEVYEKMDGSLGILYFVDDVPYISTRGSFDSDQAIEANKILKEKYSNISFQKNLTYLFEIIYPENRIVVDYGSKRDLILLAIVETQTGKEISLDDAPEGLQVVNRYDGTKDFSKVLEQFEKYSGTEFEGLVVKFKNGFRIKIKTEDYKRLHKILTNINEKRIWECISNGQGLQEILDVVPDEFCEWVRSVEKRLKDEFKIIESISKMLFDDAVDCACIDMKRELGNDEINIKLFKKYFAKYVLRCNNKLYQSVCFCMFDKSNREKIIWKSLEPIGNTKFKNVGEIEE